MKDGFHNIWKCKCMKKYKSHDSGIILMSGTWKVHASIIHRIYPYGLHREFYRVIDNDAEYIFSEDNLKINKKRNSNRLLRL